MAETAFLYHCRQHRSESEMHPIETDAGKRHRRAFPMKTGADAMLIRVYAAVQVRQVLQACQRVGNGR